MLLKPLTYAALLALPTATVAEITLEDAYIRSASPMAKTGAAYMILRNDAETDDRLIGVTTEIAIRSEVHAHTDIGDGVMQMGTVEGGLVVPAQGSLALKRGGDHVMLMGLSGPLKDGASVTMTLQFETAGEVTVQISVDQTRMPEVE